MKMCRRFAAADGFVTALEPSSVRIFSGHLTGICGPSGGGKSTLLSLIGLLDRPCDGELWLDGDRVDHLNEQDLAERRRGMIGFLFQDAGLIDRMTALDNVRLPLAYRRTSLRNATYRARDALEEVGLGHRVNALVDTLSGGERQRVGLARLLAMRPKLIVCDEPTASLDEETSRTVVTYLRRAADEGACVVCASHDPVVLDAMDDSFHLHRGEISRSRTAETRI